MQDSKCKVCRRQGERLYLKGERCYTPKCAIVRKPYAPGEHGGRRGKRRRMLSEYGTQLREKQRVRFLYGVSEKQFSNYVERSMAVRGKDAIQQLIESLEVRLDNTVFRLGLAVSRSLARQLVSHGLITVNGKTVHIPSYAVRVGDVVSVRNAGDSKSVFKALDITLKKHKTPSWLALDPGKKEGKVIALPKVGDIVKLYNVRSIIEYYSR